MALPAMGSKIQCFEYRVFNKRSVVIISSRAFRDGRGITKRSAFLCCGGLIGDQYSVKTSEGTKLVSPEDCECMFRKSMLLPCRHMFALRSKLGRPLYDSDLCDKRWTSTYYRSTQRLFSSTTHNPELLVTESSYKGRRKLSQHENFRKAVVLTSELASIASTASNVHFQRRMTLLKNLIDHWKLGEEVGLKEIDEGECRD